jgi:hypothetical protein
MLHIQVNNSFDYHTVSWLTLLQTEKKLDVLLVSLIYQSVIGKIPLTLCRLLGKNMALEGMLTLDLT